MAISSFVDVSGLTYCGQEAQEIFSKEVYSLDIRNYGITMLDGLKGKTKIYAGELSDGLFQEYSCPFSPNGEVVLSEDFIEPAALKVNLEECYDKWWPTYLVQETSITLNGGIPDTFENWFFNEQLLPAMAREYQSIFWRGDTEYTGSTSEYLKVVDGIEKILSESGNTISGSALTVDNIESQIEAAVNSAMSIAAEANTDFERYSIFMNKNDVRLLMVALGKDCSCNSTNAVFANYTRNGDQLFVYGLPVIATEQSRNTIIVANPKNLVLGFDTFSSHQEYKIIDMRETTGDNAFRVIAITNIGVGVVYPQLAVISKA